MLRSSRAAFLVAALVLVGPAPAQPNNFGQRGQAEDQDRGDGAPGDAAAAATVAPPGLDPQDGMPRITYQVSRDSAGEWVQGADHFHPVLDTPRYSNPGTPLFPGGTCYGMVRLTKRWYDTFVKPIRSNPRAYGPANAIENTLTYDSQNRRYWRVYNQNLASFRLRAYTQPRSQAYPFSDPVRTARLATAMHSDQFRGTGPFENQWQMTREAAAQRIVGMVRNFYAGDDGQPRSHAEVADLMMNAIRNRTEAGAFQQAGQVSYQGFAGFVFPMFLVPKTGGGADGQAPVLDGSQVRTGFHIVLAYKYREVRLRGSDGEHDAVEFRFYDVNRPELPEEPRGVSEGSTPSSDTEQTNRLFYLRDLERFSFHLGYMLHYADVSPDTLVLIQEGNTLLRPVGFTDLISSGPQNPIESASREAWTLGRARDRPREEFDWSGGGTGTGVSP